MHARFNLSTPSLSTRPPPSPLHQTLARALSPACAEAAADHDGELGHIGGGHRVDQLRAVLRDALSLVLRRHTRAQDKGPMPPFIGRSMRTGRLQSAYKGSLGSKCTTARERHTEAASNEAAEGEGEGGRERRRERRGRDKHSSNRKCCWLTAAALACLPTMKPVMFCKKTSGMPRWQQS
eukprot:528130-Pleurochrysis_carterae.AAC.3